MGGAGPGTPGDDESGQAAPRSPGGEQRIGNPTRLIRRRSLSAEPSATVPEAEPIDASPLEPEPGAPPGRGGLGPLFGPRSFGGGRVQVWGCSPGCLIASLLVSVLLTIFLNALL